ncbi:MAG: PLP-dependent cysteine synthase family protein [Lachnospiraceae bacterium]|jgi:cysteine synthase A
MEDRLYSSICELVGHTPLVELSGYEKEHGLSARILAKLEYFEPSGSVKDRAAYYMIREAEREGKISPGDVIIDFTSGNTGIALAAYCNALGYRFAAVLQPGVSRERTQILKAYGSIFLEFRDIPGVEEMIRSEGMNFGKFYVLIQKYADEHGYYFINQGTNPANVKAHYYGTGPEIWAAAKGKVDYFTALAGTGGTIAGCGRFLKEKNPALRIIGAQPAPSSRKDSAHPERNTIDGVTAFAGVDEDKVPAFFGQYQIHCDEVLDLDANEAYATGRDLVRSDGIFLGQSAAAAVLAARKIAERPEAAGKTIVCVCADSAYKYLSTNIYREDS